MPGITAERSTKRVAARSSSPRRGNGPNGRKLERGEIVPLSTEQSERLGKLYEEYGIRLVHYARRKLLTRGLETGAACSLAEDIAQEAWVEVARTGAKDLLSDQQFSADETRWMLFARVKTRIHCHFKQSKSHEVAVDWQDPVTCGTLCPLMFTGCALVELPGYLAQMVEELPAREREALLLHLDGMSQERIGERLGCGGATVGELVERSLLLIQINNPELSNEPISLDTLCSWERNALAKLSVAQRAALLRLEEQPRQALLLNVAEGLGSVHVAARLGVPRSRVRPTISGCASALRRLAEVDVAVAA